MHEDTDDGLHIVRLDAKKRLAALDGTFGSVEDRHDDFLQILIEHAVQEIDSRRVRISVTLGEREVCPLHFPGRVEKTQEFEEVVHSLAEALIERPSQQRDGAAGTVAMFLE